MSSHFLPICIMIVASCRKTFGHEGTAKCCKMTPVFCIIFVLTLRCQECKSPYVRKKQHVIGEKELFLFWSPQPSKSITGNRMLQQEAALTLQLLVPHDGLCLLPDGEGGRGEVLLQQPGKPSRDSYLCEHIPGNALCLCPLLLPCCCCAGCHRCSSQEKAAAVLNLLVSISPVVWLHPSVMELLIVPPFPNPSCRKD